MVAEINPAFLWLSSASSVVAVDVNDNNNSAAKDYDDEQHDLDLIYCTISYTILIEKKVGIGIIYKQHLIT